MRRASTSRMLLRSELSEFNIGASIIGIGF